MKHLLIVLSLLPLTLFAQTEQAEPAEKKKTYNNEVGINIGVLSLPTIDFAAVHPTFGFRYLHNFGNTQLGLEVMDNEYYMLHYIEPGIINKRASALSVKALLNRIIPSEKHYFYAGIAGGFYYGHWVSPKGILGNQYGYVVGAQGGFVYILGKHFTLNAELAIRTAQVWQDKVTELYYDNNPDQEYRADFFLYTPLTLGVRYRF